jgi:hypothetical protein
MDNLSKRKDDGVRAFKDAGGLARPTRPAGKSGIPGISVNGDGFYVSIYHNGKPNYVGRFMDFDKAVSALIEGRKALGVANVYRGIPDGWDLV